MAIGSTVFTVPMTPSGTSTRTLSSNARNDFLESVFASLSHLSTDTTESMTLTGTPTILSKAALFTSSPCTLAAED